MSAPLRIGLLTPWTSRLAGGVGEAVLIHARALAEAASTTPVVISARDSFSDEDAHRWSGLETCSVRYVGPKAFGYAPSMLRAVLDARVDILHLHGIWTYPSSVGADWASRTGRPYLISPHGMLSPWILARGKWKKAIARHTYEKRSWTNASLLHALTQAEAQEIKQVIPHVPIEVVPNAVTIAQPTTVEASGGRSVLYLGRIHPKKNLHNLVLAWSRLPAESRRQRTLVIAGWGEADDIAQLTRLIADLPGSGVEFVGPAYGEKKQNLIGAADFLVLPSLSEGLPMVVLEAWAASVPTIMSPECNMPEGFGAGAALQCGISADSLLRDLQAALAMEESRRVAMGRCARKLALENYSMDVVRARWEGIYAGLHGRAKSGVLGARP